MSFERGPYLNLAVFCEKVIEDKSGVISLIRVVDRLNIAAQGPTAPEEMPATRLDWTLVLNFRSGETHGSHEVKIVPHLPSGETKQPVILSVHFEGNNRGQNILAQVNMPLPIPGIYWFKVYMDEQFVTQIPVELIYSRIVTP